MKPSKILTKPSFKLFFLALFITMTCFCSLSYSEREGTSTRPCVLDFKDKTLNSAQLQEWLQKVEKNKFVGHVVWGTILEEGKSLKEKIENKIIQNNKIYRRHPSDFIHGLLSAHVYLNATKGAKVEFEESHDNYIHNQHLCHWKVHEVYDYPEAEGYYGVAYINEQTKQIVLAHRGTMVKWLDLFKDDSSLKTDLKGI